MKEDTNSLEHQSDSEVVEKVPPNVLGNIKKPSIEKDVNDFIKIVDSLADTLPFTMMLLTLSRKRSHELLRTKFNGVSSEDDDGNSCIEFTDITEKNYAEFTKLSKRLSKTSMAHDIVPQSFLVSLISQFDAFIAKFVRNVYFLKPELLKGSNKQFTFAELVEFGSIDAARLALIDKEIDAELRGSHTDHIKWLDKFANLETKDNRGIRSNLRDWPSFVELTERRNLFVHAGGQVGDQYLRVCRQNGASLEGINKGDTLNVSAKYFESAVENLIEIAIVISQVIWRQIFPEESELSNKALNNACFELLTDKKYSIVCNILDWAFKLKLPAEPKDVFLMMKINHAQASKWKGDNEKAQRILASCYWSAEGDAFELAAAVLSDKFDVAAAIMKRIGVSDIPTSEHYRTWPVFKEFRMTPLFKRAYEEIFGEPYIQENPKMGITSILSAFYEETEGESLDDARSSIDEDEHA